MSAAMITAPRAGVNGSVMPAGKNRRRFGAVEDGQVDGGLGIGRAAFGRRQLIEIEVRDRRAGSAPGRKRGSLLATRSATGIRLLVLEVMRGSAVHRASAAPEKPTRHGSPNETKAMRLAEGSSTTSRAPRQTRGGNGPTSGSIVRRRVGSRGERSIGNRMNAVGCSSPAPQHIPSPRAQVCPEEPSHASVGPIGYHTR